MRSSAGGGRRRPAAFDDFNGFHGRRGQFVITHPMHMLWALAATVLAVLLLLVWVVVRVVRRWRSLKH